MRRSSSSSTRPTAALACRHLLFAALALGTARCAWGQGYTFQTEFGSAGSGNGQFYSTSVVIDPSTQDIVVSDGGNGRMERFSLAGMYLNQVAVPSSANYSIIFFTIDPVSHNFVTFGSFSAGAIGYGAWEIFSSTGTELGSSVDSNLSPTGFVIDPASHHMLSGNYSTSVEILATSNNGTSFTYSSKFGSAGSGDSQFNSVAGVALDTVNHHIAVTDSSARVQFFTTGGTFVNSVSTGSIAPIGVALDPGKQVFVVLYEVNYVGTLRAFTYAGADLGAVGSTGSGSGQIGSASSIAIDPVSHDLVVTDNANNKVLVFAYTTDEIFKDGFE